MWTDVHAMSHERERPPPTRTPGIDAHTEARVARRSEVRAGNAGLTGPHPAYLHPKPARAARIRMCMWPVSSSLSGLQNSKVKISRARRPSGGPRRPTRRDRRHRQPRPTHDSLSQSHTRRRARGLASRGGRGARPVCSAPGSHDRSAVSSSNIQQLLDSIQYAHSHRSLGHRPRRRVDARRVGGAASVWRRVGGAASRRASLISHVATLPGGRGLRVRRSGIRGTRHTQRPHAAGELFCPRAERRALRR